MTARARILVVDDHPVNIAILEELIGDAHDVQSVMSGEEALSAANSFHPDLVLLDVMLPEMDGLEACRRLRTMPGLEGVCVIMVSACAMAEDIEAGFAAGANEYVTKPFKLTEMSALIEQHLSGLDLQTRVHSAAG